MALAEHVSEPDTVASRPYAPVRRWLRALAALSFWGAIVLPAIYLPMILAGVSGGRGLSALLALLSLHLLALIGGRSHRRSDDPSPP